MLSMVNNAVSLDAEVQLRQHVQYKMSLACKYTDTRQAISSC
jgi:hypothetical protein